MVTTGLRPSTEEQDYTDSISSGTAIGLRGFGTRLSISAAVTGDDVWMGTATTLPIPPDVGEQMQVVSTSLSDSAAGIGANTVDIHYIDAAGIMKYETVTMNGVTPVLTVATNIRFVQEMHVVSAGTNLLAVGTISLSKAAVPATIYTQIQLGTNQSLNTARMVPANKVLLITSFGCSGGAAAGGKSADVRLRATSHGRLLTPRLFHFIDNAFIFNSAALRTYEKPIVLPSLAIVKCTAYATAGGADVQASWEGFLINTPV